MGRFKTNFLFLYFGIAFVSGCSTATKQSSICAELLAPEPKAQVSFEGITQAGKEEHHLEVCYLAYYDSAEKTMVKSMYRYVVYVAGSYGPEILTKIDGPVVIMKKSSEDTVDIYYVAGAHTNLRQRWKLLGYTAKLQEEKEIEWDQIPRN